MINKRQELLQDLLEKLTRAIHNMNTVRDFPFGDWLLRRQQIMILFFVYENKGESSVKDIAKFLHVTSGAVTQFIDGLVEQGIVKRQENLSDRRSINIKLTAGTKKKFNDFRRKYLASASGSFNSLSDKELAQFIALAGKIKAPTPVNVKK